MPRNTAEEKKAYLGEKCIPRADHRNLKCQQTQAEISDGAGAGRGGSPISRGVSVGVCVSVSPKCLRARDAHNANHRRQVNSYKESRYLCICLSIYLSFNLPIYLSSYLCVYLDLSIYLDILKILLKRFV